MKSTFARHFLVTFIPAAVILVLVALLSIFFNFPIADLTRDVFSTADLLPVIGVLSNFGILLWCATASVCFFSAFTVYKVLPGKIFWFLISSALFSTYLLLDDFFMFHEALEHFHVRKGLFIGEKGLYVIFMFIGGGYLFVFRKIILGTRYLFLLLAFMFLGGMVLVDAVFPSYVYRTFGQWFYLIEDGLKWMGIVFWFSYYSNTSYSFLRANLQNPEHKTSNQAG